MPYGRPLLSTSIRSFRLTTASSRLSSSLRTTARTSDHNNLASFQAYADRTGLNKNSTVYRGTKYEYTTIDAVHRFYLDLERQGGRDDLGIDLLGTWSLPLFAHPIHVLVSCKSHAKVAQANWIRELEGAFAGDPRGAKDGRIVGFLVARGQATSGVRDAVARSNAPVGFINVTLEGNVRQMLWNEKVANMGLERVTPKRRNQESECGDDIAEENVMTIVLMEKDKILDKVYGSHANVS